MRKYKTSSPFYIPSFIPAWLLNFLFQLKQWKCFPLKILYLCVLHSKTLTMATVILDTRSTEAKKMLEFLKATRYARVIEENTPNDETISAIQEVEAGKLNSYGSAKEMMASLKKKAGV